MSTTKTSTLSATTDYLIFNFRGTDFDDKLPFVSPQKEKGYMEANATLEATLAAVRHQEVDQTTATHTTTKEDLPISNQDVILMRKKMADLSERLIEDQEYFDGMLEFKDTEIARLQEEISTYRTASRLSESNLSSIQKNNDELTKQFEGLNGEIDLLRTENSSLRTQVALLNKASLNRLAARAIETSDSAPELLSDVLKFSEALAASRPSHETLENTITDVYASYATTAEALAQCGRYVRHGEHQRYLSRSSKSSASTTSDNVELQPLSYDEDLSIRVRNDAAHAPQAIIDAALAIERDLDRRGSGMRSSSTSSTEFDYRSVYGVPPSVAWHLRQCNTMISIYEARARLHFLWGSEGERDQQGTPVHDGKYERLFDGLQQRAEILMPSILNPPIAALNKDEARRFGLKLESDKKFKQLKQQFNSLSWAKLKKAEEARRSPEGFGVRESPGKKGMSCYQCGGLRHVAKDCVKEQHII